MKSRGSILVGVLWCMVLLSVIVIGVLHTSRMDLMVVKNYGDSVQAHYLALAGVERAKAVIYQDILARQRSGKNHTGSLYRDAKDFQDFPLRRGQFSVFHRASQEDGGGLVYGISDEESRLNLNVASPNQFTNFNGMTTDILNAIMAWRTPVAQNPNNNGNNNNNSSTPGGANTDYYMSLHPPYLPRNGPFQTVRELLMVRGVTADLLLGNDDNQNGFLDSDDDPLDRGMAGFSPAPPPRPGWAALLTVTDTDKDVDASGKDRINPQNADEAALTGVPGITPEIARAIISYRGQTQLQNLGDLLSVTPQNQNARVNGNGPGNGNNSGAAVISQDLFEQIADQLTLASGSDLPGLINVNTASLKVLMCLPGIDEALAQAMINYRKSSGYFDNVAMLLRVNGMTRDIFKQVIPLITVRSETYRIMCEGKIPTSGSRQRIEEIVHIGAKDIETLAYREDL